MSDSETLREIIRKSLPDIVKKLNEYLRGENVREIKPILERVGYGSRLPHWYGLLETGQSMPNLDGKTIGSVIEMTLLGVLEKHTLIDYHIPALTINPAKGIDIPYLELGVKSPSENYCTSEPYFSAYDRLLGNEYDALILLTDYQTAKKNPPPVRIQIIKATYLRGSEIADRKLCRLALKHREQLLQESDTLCKKLFQFLSFINQQDWRAKALLSLVDILFSNDDSIQGRISLIEEKFNQKKRLDIAAKKVPIPDEELKKILLIKTSTPKVQAIINACSDWVIETHKDFARLPNDNEWHRFKTSPLNGKIGMSFALQWRYNFGNLFSSLPEF